MTLLSYDGGPVIVGAGLAGLATALALAPLPCTVLSASRLGDGTSTAWAQGGIAVALAATDTPALHAADTLAAGDGLCDPATVRRITEAGPNAIAHLATWGALFDRGPDGRYALGLEAAHGRRRIAHAAGDATGRVILRALLARARATPSIRLLERTTARALLTDGEGRIAALLVHTRTGPEILATSRVVLATGGLGGLFGHTTNPLTATGAGVALAARAGATLADLEFVQFHPTAIDIGRDPMPLASEAIRGEGATLVDETGRRFMPDHDARAELAPRDIVARAIVAERAAGHRTFLDATAALGPRFHTHFPNIARVCAGAGLDPATDPIPVLPAAHYAMGGIRTDAAGRTDITGLWAVGECAATGLHGANRLASNSLLEAAVTGALAAEDLAGASLPRRRPAHAPTLSHPLPVAPIRPIMSAGFGVTRDAAAMTDAARRLLALAGHADPDALTAAVLVAASALARTESRGAHHRLDHPAHAPDAVRSRITLAEAQSRLAPLAATRSRRRA